jgi:hypothetical protein
MNMVSRPLTQAKSKVFAGQIKQLPNANKFSRFSTTTVMQASTSTESAAQTKTAGPSIDLGSVGAAFNTKIAAASAQAKSPAPVKMAFHIENSSLANGMWCIEDD